MVSGGEEGWRRKRRRIFGKGKSSVSGEEEKQRVGRGGKYLEKEKLGHRREKEKIFEDGKSDDRQTNRISSCTLDPFLC